MRFQSCLIGLLCLVGSIFVSTRTAGAVVVPFQAELRLAVGRFPTVAFGDAGVAVVNGSASGNHITQIGFGAGAVAGTVLEPVTDPLAFPVTGLRLNAANAAGSLARTAGGTLRGAMAIPGSVKVCLFGQNSDCAGSVTENLTVPISVVGQGGTGYATGQLNITVVGAPWTTGSASVGTVTAMGFAHGPASATSSTARPSGVLRLVTPVFVSTNVPALAIVPTFASLTLHFVPEPGTLVLLGAGAIALAIGGRRRLR